MDWWIILLVLFGGLGLLLALGMPVAFAFLIMNLGGAYFIFGGGPGLLQLVISIYDSVTKFTYLALPLFILMSELLFRSGQGTEAIDILAKWLGRIPGRLSLVAVIGGALIAAVSGSGTGATAMLGSLLMPDMEARGYKKLMSLGPILASGCLAIIIPPSGLCVLLAAIAYISVGDLLVAGIIPGILIACLYAIYIIAICSLWPHLAPSYKVAPTPLSDKIRDSMRNILPLGFIVFLVTGLIFLGIATPSESAATGVIGVLILAVLKRRVSWSVIKTSLSATIEITIMIFMILTGSAAFSQILAFSGAGTGLTELVIGLPVGPILIIIMMQLVVLFLGCFMDQVAIMMITLPIYMPIVRTMGLDEVWFGLLILISIEVAMLTPPFGLGLFVMKGVAPPDTRTVDIYLSGLPFVVLDLIAMALIMAAPQIALWLPGMLH